MIRQLITLLTLILALPLHAAEVYRTVDKEGNVVFTDQRTPDAERVNLKPVMTVPSQNIVDPTGRRKVAEAATGDEAAAAATVRYKQLAILAPADEETIRDNTGNFNVSVGLSPAPQAGHTAQLLMNGSVHATIAGPTSILMENVDRGAHRFRVRVIDTETRRMVQEGDEITIFVHRAALPRPTPR